MTLTRIVSADKGPVVKEKINAIIDEVENGGTAPVTSVNGRTGVVVGLAEASDIPTDFVDLSTAQTKAGVLTFTSSPIVPEPTTDTQVANKKYVDDNAGGGGGGFNPLYPHGFGASYQGIDVTTYTVPAGKVFYLTHTNIGQTTQTVSIGGLNAVGQRFSATFDAYIAFVNPFIIPEGVVISGASALYGFICDANANIEPIYTSGSYTVPVGKKLVINNFINPYTDLQINSKLFYRFENFGIPEQDVSMNVLHSPLILDAGVIFNSTNETSVNMFGYLIPDTFNI